MHVYEVRPPSDKRGVDLISDVLPFGRLVGMPSRTSHCSGLNPVFQLRLARRASAVCAAVDLSVGFNAVPDNPAVAVRANRRQRMDRALEAVEGVPFSTNDYLKRLVIFIFANFACSHT